ncbi:peptidylprolyl isomerase [Vibrio sp. S4M6]|uniref:peptidylprolyl isomerase n=1 Tax=Vibrio sinus TaxID=2946865 RepID=UPI002029E96D|nr:peptidylprolyl isomerase [Vibrio sinus]MCL9782206.1 peptidylprolyl isomerase [Vibrio sinus]
MIRAFIASLALFSCLAFAGPEVKFETNVGNFTVELNTEKAPITTKNFLRYVNDGSYVGSIFHRVIPGFMVQGGGFDKEMNRLNSYPPIKNEASNGLKNLKATIAMARTSDPNSATRQFFINLVNNDFLDHSATQDGYAVFGKVVKGFNVIEDIAKKPTHSLGQMRNVPIQPIVITNVTLLKP